MQKAECSNAECRLPGPHRRWGGAISAVNPKPQAEDLRRRNSFPPSILNPKGSRKIEDFVGTGDIIEAFIMEQIQV